MSHKTEELRKIKDEVVALTESPLYAYRTENNFFPVLGEGSHDAKIMFIGEAPGANEAKTGRPFVGAAGKVLEGLLNKVGIDRKDVYITNIIKDRPPENRDPSPDEIALYVPFLDREIEIIKPKVVATLGRFAMTYAMNRYGLEAELAPISVLHGKVFDTEIGREKVKVVPLFHPGVGRRKLMPTLEQDFQVLAKI